MPKKLLGLLLVLLLAALPLTGCAAPQAEIAMVTDASGVEDRSFNQGCWEGIWLYANLNTKSCNYYTPARQSETAYTSSIDSAVKNGAKIVVAPGDLLSGCVAAAQEKYPDVTFVALDTEPTGGPAHNTVSVLFAEEQAGYLAGYAAVREGYTELGFIGGMALPAVARYGLGYLEGAAAAAQTQNTTVRVRYTYADSFEPSAEARALAAGWYDEGAQVIFACAGGLNQSVFDAAEAKDGLTIGVDMDQSAQSPSVLTSALKNTGAAAGQMLELYYKGSFPGGQSVILGVGDGAVGLVMEGSRLQRFSQREYEQLTAAMLAGDITPAREDVLEGGADPTAFAQGLGGLELDYRYG